MKDIHDVIKHAKFGDDRLRGSGVVAGQFSAFPIDFAGRPYNTLTLPCERVIISIEAKTVETTHSAACVIVTGPITCCHDEGKDEHGYFIARKKTCKPSITITKALKCRHRKY